MDDTFTFTLDEETEKRLFDLLTDVDVSKTPSFTIEDKHGNEAEYVKVVRCKDCTFWRTTDHTCHEHSLVSPMSANEFCSRGERKQQ